MSGPRKVVIALSHTDEGLRLSHTFQDAVVMATGSRPLRDTREGSTTYTISEDDLRATVEHLRAVLAVAEGREPLIAGDLSEAVYSARRTGGTYTAERAGLRWTISAEAVE